MRRILTTTVLLTLLAAAPAEARCRVVLESGDYRLGRSARGWELCGHGVTFGPAGRPVALDARGKAVAVRIRDGRRTVIRWVELAGRRHSRGKTVLGAGERFVGQAFADYGLYVAVGGARPHVRRTGNSPDGVIDRSPGLALRSLRRRGGAVSWRVGGERRRVSAIDGRDLPPGDCRVPGYARAVTRVGRAVTYELRLGDPYYEGQVYGCLDGGRPHKVGETSNDLAIEAFETLLLAEPFAVFEETFSWKDTSQEVVAVDLRTGATTARAWFGGGAVRLVVSRTGAVAFTQSSADQHYVNAARGYEVKTIDGGPAVDPASLTLDGTTLSWTSGGERRTAELP